MANKKLSKGSICSSGHTVNISGVDNEAHCLQIWKYMYIYTNIVLSVRHYHAAIMNKHSVCIVCLDKFTLGTVILLYSWRMVLFCASHKCTRLVRFYLNTLPQGCPKCSLGANRFVRHAFVLFSNLA